MLRLVGLLISKNAVGRPVFLGSSRLRLNILVLVLGRSVKGSRQDWAQHASLRVGAVSKGVAPRPLFASLY